MHLRIGDTVRHIFNANIRGKIIELRQENNGTMSTGGSFTPRRYALIESREGKQAWISFDDIMKDE